MSDPPRPAAPSQDLATVISRLCRPRPGKSVNGWLKDGFYGLTATLPAAKQIAS